MRSSDLLQCIGRIQINPPFKGMASYYSWMIESSSLIDVVSPKDMMRKVVVNSWFARSVSAGIQPLLNET